MSRKLGPLENAIGSSVRVPGDEEVKPAKQLMDRARALSGSLNTDSFWLPVVMVVGSAGVFLRSPAVLLRPQLYAEDGTVWFSQAYNHGWFAPLSWPNAGYLQIFSRLVADIGLFVPLTRVPLLFAAVAVIVQVAPAALLCSQRFARVIPRRGVRLVIAALYLALPNAAEVNGVLTNTQWHLALIGFLVVVASPGSVPWRIFDVVSIFMMGLSGPFALALLVVAALYVWRVRGRWTLVLVAELALFVSIQGYEVATSARSTYTALGASAARFAQIVGGEIVGGTFLGQSTVSSLHTFHWTLVSTVLTGAGLFLVGAAIVKGPIELKLFNVFVALILGASLATPIGSLSTNEWASLALGSNSRYYFLPVVALIFDVVWLATRFNVRAIAVLGVALLVVLCVGGVREDWSLRAPPNLHWAAEVDAFEKLPPGVGQVFKETPPGWSFVLGHLAPTVLRPAHGATLSGTVVLDASPQKDTRVEFRLRSGSYGSSSPVLCSAGLTRYGWLCQWNSASVSNGTYVLRAEFFSGHHRTYSAGIKVIVANG